MVTRRGLKEAVASRHEQLELKPWEPALTLHQPSGEWPQIVLAHPPLEPGDERIVEDAVKRTLRRLFDTQPDFRIRRAAAGRGGRVRYGLPSSYRFSAFPLTLNLKGERLRIGVRVRLPQESDAMGWKRLQRLVGEVKTHLGYDTEYWQVLKKYAKA